METLSFDRWSEFRAFIEEERFVVAVYWRGQRDPRWALASSFERSILRLNGGWKDEASQLWPYDSRYDRDGSRTWAAGFEHSMRDGYLRRFKEAASGRRGTHPADLSEDQWWALGRHLGLVTPLLDWTEAPYIAAFFALSELYERMSAGGGGLIFNGDQVAIYRLVHNDLLEGDGLRVLKPLADELHRMHGQRGVFTWLDSEEYFELQGFLDRHERGGLLTKILLSDQVVLAGLKDLDNHGIDHKLLFPDLDGAARYANRLPVPIF